MFEVIKGSETIALIEKPNYILHNGNCYVLCDADKATGVAINGTPYHLFGKNELTGTEETVLLCEKDAGIVLKETDAATRATMENLLCEMDMENAEQLGVIENALCELDGGETA